MTPIFCDTSGFYALIDVSEAQHSIAAAIWKRVIRDRHRLVTSNYVITEMIAVTQARLGLHAVRAFLQRIEDFVEPLWVDRALHEGALNELLGQNRRQLSLVDCTSFALMRRHRIVEAFAVDADFKDYGFTVVQA